MTGEDFFQLLRSNSYNFFSGVPCSSIAPLFNAVESSSDLIYVNAVQEGEAVAICAGAWLAGKNPVVVCQNSGLGNLVNPISSLLNVYRIPLLVISSWRGMPGAIDEPQHDFMGKITIDLLNILDVKSFVVSKENFVDEYIRRSSYENFYLKKSTALIIAPDFFQKLGAIHREGTSRPCGLFFNSRAKSERLLSRMESLEIIVNSIGDICSFVSTTGYCSRELFTIKDDKNNFYMAGSMGCASAIGLGLSLNSKKFVAVLDGDGALLMKMGSLATVGRYQPTNLLHIVFDNGINDSTGAQPTNGQGVPFALVAAHAGYKNTWVVQGRNELIEVLSLSKKMAGPNFIQVKINNKSLINLKRPNLSLPEIASRFKNQILECDK